MTSNTTMIGSQSFLWPKDHIAIRLKYFYGTGNSTTVNLLNIVIVEFDPKKSDSKDIDDTHVGVDIKGIYSRMQEPLIGHGVNLSPGQDITATIQRDAKSDNIAVFVFLTGTGETGEGKFYNPVLNVTLDLSTQHLADILVGLRLQPGECGVGSCQILGFQQFWDRR
ncbi:hypothetical protein SLA2020_128420 [Shorea laevis]